MLDPSDSGLAHETPRFSPEALESAWQMQRRGCDFFPIHTFANQTLHFSCLDLPMFLFD